MSSSGRANFSRKTSWRSPSTWTGYRCAKAVLIRRRSLVLCSLCVGLLFVLPLVVLGFRLSLPPLASGARSGRLRGPWDLASSSRSGTAIWSHFPGRSCCARISLPFAAITSCSVHVTSAQLHLPCQLARRTNQFPCGGMGSGPSKSCVVPASLFVPLSADIEQQRLRRIASCLLVVFSRSPPHLAARLARVALVMD